MMLLYQYGKKPNESVLVKIFFHFGEVNTKH